VTLAPASQTIKAAEDASETTFSFDAMQSGTTTDLVYPDVQYDKTLFALQGTPTLASGKYVVAFKTAKDLGGDSYKGNITFRLCRDAACATVYPGSTQTFAYTFDVQLKDWEALQRNAAHTGYVHATFDPASFKKAWDWTPAEAVVSPVATKGAMVFVTRQNVDRTFSVHALSSVTGAESWAYNLGSVSHASAPSLAGNQIYTSTMVSSSSDNKNIVLNATTGQYLRSTSFAAQWSFFAPPTPFGTELYMAAGYYGGAVYGYNAIAGTQLWMEYATRGGPTDGETPAVDDKYVYYYTGRSLDIFDRMSGAVVKSIPDPFAVSTGYSYRAGPILGSKGNAMAYSGTFYGGPSYTAGFSQPKILVNFSLATSAYVWRTADVYETVPALAKGVVYVARNNPTRLDAVSEETGSVLWNWAPPTGEAFLGNAVATDTLVFISTDKAVYAVSTTGATHASVWSAATPGEIAISGDNRLIVSSRGASLNKLSAYTLR
jgi:hypothetical protein